MKGNAFFKAFTAEVCSSLFNDWSDNYDELCFGPEPKDRVLSNDGSLKHWIRRWLNQPSSQNGAEVVAIFRTAFDFVAPYLERLEPLYAQLADKESQSLLVKLMAFRALGHRKVKLPFNTPENRQGIVRYEAVCSVSDCIEAGFSGWKLRRLDLTTLGVPISLYSLPWTTFLQFGVQQYRCDCAPHAIEPVAGDYVLDGGAGWGDTALQGAELAALKGAEHTLRRFKPKLAICVYHRLEDFFDIPDYLASLQLGYRFFLRHFTIHIDETVLFATVN